MKKEEELKLREELVTRPPPETIDQQIYLLKRRIRELEAIKQQERLDKSPNSKINSPNRYDKNASKILEEKFNKLCEEIANQMVKTPPSRKAQRPQSAPVKSKRRSPILQMTPQFTVNEINQKPLNEKLKSINQKFKERMAAESSRFGK